jgi:hypothetical protein
LVVKVADLEDRVRHLEDESDDVVGAASSTDSDLMEFSGTTGKKAKDGGLTHANVADAIAKKHSNSLDHANTNDPTADQKAALAGTNGAPSASNKYVTNSDPRNTDARTPASHDNSKHSVAYLSSLAGAWPIGSVYLAVVATNPATLLGFGTWAQIAIGQMLVGFKTADADFGTVEKTGGSKTASHTNNHSGTAITDHPSSSNKQGTAAGNVITTGNHVITQPAAHGDHNIINPYFVVYVWKRTA